MITGFHFLWPLANKEIDYLFVIAYLNSKLVSFLYKAKNISIKRSKTKLEYGLPLPHPNNLRTEEKTILVDLIKNLTSRIINNTKNNHTRRIEELLDKILSYGYLSPIINYQFKEEVIKAFEKNNKNNIKMIIDTLFFWLFNLDENDIDNLLIEYYTH